MVFYPFWTLTATLPVGGSEIEEVFVMFVINILLMTSCVLVGIGIGWIIGCSHGQSSMITAILSDDRRLIEKLDKALAKDPSLLEPSIKTIRHELLISMERLDALR